jgi:hypothetical protein
LPDLFPLPFGFQLDDFLFLKGKRIYPPAIWSKADLKWKIRTNQLVLFARSYEHTKKYILDYMADWAMVLPLDHPIHKFVNKGRPLKKKPDGSTCM